MRVAIIGRYCFFVFVLFIYSLAICYSQENNSAYWTRLQTEDSDFSISFPMHFLVDKTENPQKVYGQENDVSMKLSMERTSNAVNQLNELFRLKDSRKNYKFYSIGNIQIAEYRKIIDQSKRFWMSLYIATNKGFYHVSVSSDREENETIKQFLFSILLKDIPMFVQNKSFPKEKSVISTKLLKTSVEVVLALGKDDSQQKDLINVEKSENIADAELKGLSKNLVIIRQPYALYTDSSRRRNIGGIVKLHATFLSNGEITEIKLVKSLDKDLDKQAFAAAKKIKFIPAQKDGKPIDVKRSLEYSFTIY